MYVLTLCGFDLKLGRKRPNLRATFYTLALLSLGVVMNTQMQLLACRRLSSSSSSSEVVYYYSGATQCYDIVWIVNALLLMCELCGFVVLFVIMYRTPKQDRESTKFRYYYLVKNYKHKYWFWEVKTHSTHSLRHCMCFMCFMCFMCACSL